MTTHVGAGDLISRGNALLLRAAREPLVHFLAIGALLFAAIYGVRALERPVLRLDPEEIEQLAQYWAMQADRPPTQAELKGMIQDRIDEELLAREAIRLGMDRDDMIIRRRLAQKMSFASEDLGADARPSTETLRSAYEATKATYATPTQIAFRHVFFSADRGAGPAKAAASAALARAERGEAVSGDPSLLPLTYADASPINLSRDYGPEFAKAVVQAPLKRWIGPVQSAFGEHIIFVDVKQASVTPPFDGVKGQVLDAYLTDQRRAKNQAFLEQLRKKYRVVVAEPKP